MEALGLRTTIFSDGKFSAKGFPPTLYHYGEPEHIDRFFEDGSIQIGTVRSYDTATHGPMIGDDQEGLSWHVITDENAQQWVASGKPLPAGPLGVPMFLRPNSQGNCHVIQNISFNYAIFCVSNCLHRDLCTNFKSTYAAAIVIEEIEPFFEYLTKALWDSGLVEQALLRTLSRVEYRDRRLTAGEDVVEALVKEPRYAHQAEVRALWNVGDNISQPWFRFKAPEAVRFCKKLQIEHMPTYAPGAPIEVHVEQLEFAAQKAREGAISLR